LQKKANHVHLAPMEHKAPMIPAAPAIDKINSTQMHPIFNAPPGQRAPPKLDKLGMNHININ
jgi:hypothetical protein